MKKLIAAILCCCAIAVSASVSAISASAVKTTCDTYSGSNAEEQNYSRAYASPIESYLTKTSSGGLMRVQGDAVDGKILVEYYDSSYNITSSKTVSAELPIFGGFYESRDNYYIISGQENLSENNALEVYRITKYDKSWNKIKSCGLYGANTYIPFDAGSARMTDDGSYLLIRTCHEMYASDDGLHHQANVTIQVDMASMTITDYFAGVMNNSCGYVSHSFNQFIKVENGHIIAVDHGDAYPRSIVLTKYNTNYTSGKFFPSSGSPCTVTDLLTFPGKTGDNYTGASVGGFEISDSTYIVAGNYVGDSAYSSSNSSSTRNIFVATLAKNSSQPTVNMLTSYTTGTASTPHLVKLGANSFMLLWSHDGKVYYTKLDGYGKQSGSIYSMSGKLSDCVPLVYNGKLVWYVWENETVTFYSIDTTSLSSNSKTEINNGHKFTTKVAANSNIAVQTCTQCGFQRNITVLTDFDVYWNSDGGSTYHSRCDDTYHPGDTLNLWVLYDSADNTDMVYEVSDSSVAQLSGTKYYNRASIAMKTTGTFTLKIYPRYNTSCVQSYTFTVQHDYDSGKITKAATCSATGVKTYTCNTCGATKTETVAKTAHSYDSGKITKPATCTATGVKTYTCTKCSATKTETVAKTAHSYDSGKVTKAATCAATGVKTYTCSVCGATKTETIAKTTSHKYDSGKVTKPATCAATGVKTYTCSVCGATKTETIAKTTSHKYDSGKVTKPATCAATGVRTYTCSVCGATKTETIAKTTSHKYGSGKVTKPATCAATGAKTFTCSVCGATKTESIAKTTSHKYDSGKVTKPATCAATGAKTFTCSVCGATKTESIAKTTSHKYDSGKVTKPATCAATGVKTYTCSVCGATKTETIAKTTSHKYGSGKVTKPATCAATGVKTYTCSVCGATKTESIAKTTSHKYDSGKVTKAATCAEEGITTYTCTVCGVTKTATTEKTTTHSYDSGTITTEATYGATGVKTYTCTVCGAKKISSIAKKTIKKLTAKSTFTCTSSAIRINWNKLSGVTGYKIFRYDDANKKWVAVKAVYDPNATNYKISGLKSGKVYKFRVKAFVKENNKFYFGESCSTISTATRPNTTTVTKANKTSTAVRLFWKKTTCTGYRILRYDSAKKKWVRVTAVSSSSTTQYKISGLKKNTTYKFKIQPYVKVGSKVIDGASSAVFTVKTAK